MSDHVELELPGGRVLFTTRHGGVSDGPYASLNLGLWTDDDPARVRENRARVAAAAGVPADRLAQGRQEHATTVRALTGPPPAGDPPPADGQATSAEGVAPIVLVADCLPVAFVAREAVAMLHCGWRGLAGGIVAEGVAALRALGAEGEVAAAIGPGARRCCYEVGDEVRAAFARHGDAVRDGRNLDLPQIARRELAEAGVAHVEDTRLCTMCDPERFFSHRAAGGVTGRQAGVAWRV